MISLSSLMRTPIDVRKACVSASVLDISSEKSSDEARVVKGTAGPRACAMPIAIAVFPVLRTPESASLPDWLQVGQQIKVRRRALEVLRLAPRARRFCLA